MLLCIPNVLTKQQVAQCRAQLDAAEWVDGKVTAGQQAATAKNNLQLAQSSPLAQNLGDFILDLLQNSRTRRNPNILELDSHARFDVLRSRGVVDGGKGRVSQITVGH